MKISKLKIKYFSISEFISIFIAFVILSALPAIMYGRELQKIIFNEYTVWYILYCLIVTTVICCITAYQKYRTFSGPLIKLSQAAKAVAQGDFSIYIEPLHTTEKRDYMDLMFEDFNHMVKELGSIETLKNDFISSVSHELKTPLAIIQNYTTMLKNPLLSPQQKNEYLSSIIEATQKLSHLVTNILRLNKLENQELPITTTTYDLCWQISDCVIQYESLLAVKHLEIEMDIEDRAIIEADQELLTIVWNNLLSNAIKFSRDYGKIRIHQVTENDTILVSISDNGCGMSEDTMRHIFDKFYQADASHSHEGNGLGLALVNRITDKMNGTVSVTSQLQHGTTFYIRLNKKQH